MVKHARWMTALLALCTLVAAGLLTACGGGGGGGVASGGSVAGGGGTATGGGAAAQNSITLTWNVQTPIAATLNTGLGQSANSPLTCRSADTNVLLVAFDCAWAKTLRLGNTALTATTPQGGVINVTIRGVPQRQAMMSSSLSENGFKVLDSSGTPWFWGAGEANKLAQFTSDTTFAAIDSAKPLQGKLSDKGLMSSMYSVSSGTRAASNLALNEQGEVLSWGGDGSTLGRLTGMNILPANVGNASTGQQLKNMVQVQVGDKNAAALRDDGLVYAWGDPRVVGRGPGLLSAVYPEQVLTSPGVPLRNVVQISAGSNFTLALTATGEVYIWGANDGLKMKNTDGTQSSHYFWATRVSSDPNGQPLRDVVSVAAGQAHALALTTSGYVFAWGSNTYGQLGRGYSSFSTVGLSPDLVRAPSGYTYLYNVVSISAGQHHSLALMGDGSIVSWGGTSASEPYLGAGPYSREGDLMPFYVVDMDNAGALRGIVSISATPTASYALTTNGEVLSWGHNFAGSLGTGKLYFGLNSSTMPVRVVTTTGDARLVLGDLSQFKNLNQRYR
jgi:alpha-tubulin suppressor-like RCC1 family protein